MAEIVTIRLDAERRKLFDAEASRRNVGPSTLARELIDERLRDLRCAQIRSESISAAQRYHAAVAAGEVVESADGFDFGAWAGMAPYEGTVGGSRP